jgi:hypothetical protein
MAKGKSVMHAREEFITQPEVAAILALIAECTCYRCKLKYGGHAAADHFFFEDPEDVPFDESN